MQRLFPTLFIVLVLSPCANGSERLRYDSAAQKVAQTGLATDLVRAAAFTHSNKYYQRDKTKSQHEAISYMEKTARIDSTQMIQNPLDCLSNLAPDFCWYSVPTEVDNTQPAADLGFQYFKNSAPVSEEFCSTVNQPCDKPDSQDESHINVATGDNPAQPKKTISAGSKVKLDFFSISLIF